MPTLLRNADPEDAAAASTLVFATGPSYFRYVFGLGDEARALRFIESAFRSRKGPFSHAHAVVSVEGEAVGGIALGYPTDEKPAIERSMVTSLARSYRPWEWPTFLKRGLEAQRLLQGVPAHAFYLTAIAVIPERRGTGVAATLMGEVVRRARGGGMRTVMLHVAANNARARAFYVRSGFRVVAEFSDPRLETRTGLEGQVAMVHDVG